MKKRTALRSLTGLIALGLVLTGCTSGPADPDGTPANAELVDFLWTGPALPATTDPVETGALQAVLASEMAGVPVRYDVDKLKDNGCTELASIDDITGDLAESWSFSGDRKTVTMKFREAQSSFGNTLTSEDVKWSFDRARALGATVQALLRSTSLWADGDAVKIVDERTIAISLKQAGALDIALFVQPRWVIMDSVEAKKHATADDPWATKFLQKNSANFGPWKWTEADWTPGKELILTRNSNYYAPEEYGNIGRAIMRVIPEGSTRAQLVNSGEVDYAGQLAPADYKLVKDSGKAQLLDCAAGDRDTLILQQADKRFADPRVRQAISLAIDRESLAQAAYQGQGARPATDGLSQAYKFPRPASADRLKFDPAEAKRLLAEAGYPNGFSFELLYSPGRPGPQAEQEAVNVKAMLADVGIDVAVRLIASPADFQSTFLEGRYEALIYQEPPAIPDPAYTTGIYSLCKGFQNSYGYCDADYDRLQKVLATTPSGAERTSAMTEISTVVARTVPVVYLLDTTLPRAFSANIDVKTYFHIPYATTLHMYRLAKSAN